MNKIELTSNEIKMERFEFDGQIIEVKPFFSISEKHSVFTEYLKNYFREDDDGKDIALNYVVAENGFILQTIDFLTNISIDNLNLDYVINSGIWESIKTRIKYYNDIVADLRLLVERKKFEYTIDNSTGIILGDTITKINKSLENFNPEDLGKIKQIMNDFTGELKQLDEKVPGILAKKVRKPRAKKGNSEQ